MKPFVAATRLLPAACSALRFASALPQTVARSSAQQTCTIQASRNGSDDAPAILSAFQECGQGGRIVFQNTTYNINTVMNTTGLSDVHVDVYGYLLVSTSVRRRTGTQDADMPDHSGATTLHTG